MLIPCPRCTGRGRTEGDGDGRDCPVCARSGRVNPEVLIALASGRIVDAAAQMLADAQTIAATLAGCAPTRRPTRSSPPDRAAPVQSVPVHYAGSVSNAPGAEAAILAALDKAATGRGRRVEHHPDPLTSAAAIDAITAARRAAHDRERLDDDEGEAGEDEDEDEDDDEATDELDEAHAAALRDLGRAEAEHDARVFLVKLIDAARQGDALPGIMERIARRAGWSDDDAFALAEELASPRGSAAETDARLDPLDPLDPVELAERLADRYPLPADIIAAARRAGVRVGRVRVAPVAVETWGGIIRAAEQDAARVDGAPLTLADLAALLAEEPAR